MLKVGGILDSRGYIKRLKVTLWSRSKSDVEIITHLSFNEITLGVLIVLIELVLLICS